MGYAIISEVRDIIGITTSDMDDTDLQDMIDRATQMIVEDLAISVRDEVMSGSINGTNTTFSVSSYPMADINGDKTLGVEDITVYQWTDADNPSTKSSIPVTTIYDREGKLVITTAPTTTVKRISIDYSYTFEHTINWELMKLACSYLVGYLFANKTFTILPELIIRGPLRSRYYSQPSIRYLRRYYEMMNLIKSKDYAKKTASQTGLQRKRFA